MRVLTLAAAFAAFAAAASAGENWIAQCLGKDSQYTQVVGGAGFFHVTNGDRTYDTQKLVQNFYNGSMVCGIPNPKAPRAMSDIAMICADKTAKTVTVLPRTESEGKKLIPSSTRLYCNARIDVLKR